MRSDDVHPDKFEFALPAALPLLLLSAQIAKYSRPKKNFPLQHGLVNAIELFEFCGGQCPTFDTTAACKVEPVQIDGWRAHLQLALHMMRAS